MFPFAILPIVLGKHDFFELEHKIPSLKKIDSAPMCFRMFFGCQKRLICGYSLDFWTKIKSKTIFGNDIMSPFC